MGLEDDSSPPKKKLKQAQLSFANALKNQKRKLSSDNNDDMHINKIICKETEKENVEVNSKTIRGLSEKRTQPDCDIVSEKSKNNESDILITEDIPTTPPIKEKSSVKEIKEEDKSLGDFSLVISDSVLNSINHKAVENEQDKTIESSAFEKTSVFQTSEADLNVSDVEMLDESQISAEEELDKTINSEDDFCTSSEESPINKISPNAKRKLTPKRLESLKRKEEKKRFMLEKKTLREKAKEEKLKLKQEKLDMKKKDREEKEKKRLADLKIKEEEKKIKEEEKRVKEEEKRLKEEEKRKKDEAKEEEKRKKGEMSEKEKAAFANFFISKKKQLTDSSEKHKENVEIKFMPFPMKSDMRLATEPRHSINMEDKVLLDSAIANINENNTDLYLKELKSGLHKPKKTDATWPLVRQEEDHDVIIIESTADGECIDLTSSKVIDNKKKIRAKLLQFHDNRRPPYWGTWRKKSKTLGPRKPLRLDKEIFDYEVDSDSEWEDEGEGEDIDKEGDSDEEPGEEEDNAGENGYILDNTFVPHGYLSDEEVHPDDDVDDNNPENIKLRMKYLKQEFDEEMNTKTERLKPRLLGCVWISNGITEVSAGSLYETLMRFRAIWNEDEGCIDLSGPEIEESPTSNHPTRIKFPLTMIPVLAKFLHGGHLPFSALVKEFLLLLEKEYPTENISKRAITLKIKEIASKTYDSNGKSVWVVSSELCKEFGLKTIDNISNILPSPQPVVEKPKESLLVNFLKGSQTPQSVKKRVSLIPVVDSSNKNETENSNYTLTPRPKAGDAIVKKRAQLITLSRTPGNPKNSSVHKDTPRPTHTAMLNEIVDLCDESS